MEFDWEYAEYLGCDPRYNDCSDEITRLEDDVYNAILERIFSEAGLRRIVYATDERRAGRLATALALIELGCMTISFDGKVSPDWRSAKITRVEIGYDFNFGLDFIEFEFAPVMWKVVVYPCRKCCNPYPELKRTRAEIAARLRALYEERRRRKRVMVSRAVGAIRRYLWEHAGLSDDVIDALTDLETGNYVFSAEEPCEHHLVEGGWWIEYAEVSRSTSGVMINAYFHSGPHPGCYRFNIKVESAGGRGERWRRARDRIERRLLAARAAEAL
jgi:hypothetical protein